MSSNYQGLKDLKGTPLGNLEGESTRLKAGARGGDERRDKALAVERSDLEDEPQLQTIMLAKVRDRDSEILGASCLMEHE